MPFYEYQCQACGAHTEVLQKISDAPLKKCPECGRAKLVKLVSAPVFRLKGGGWYETDFKSDKDKKRNLVDSSKPEAAPADNSKAEAKPAKPEAAPAATQSRPKAKAKAKAKKPAAGSTARRTRR